MTTSRMGAIALAWLIVAALAGATGWPTLLRPPGPQIAILILSVLTWLALTRPAGVRAWTMGVDPRVLVLPHLGRVAAGVAFLAYAQRGMLPSAFAVRAGVGDIVVGVAAAGLMVLGRPDTDPKRRAFLTWNVLGLADIVMVVVAAARAGLRAPESMASLLQLPMVLAPLFLVPIIFATHALLFQRLRSSFRYGDARS